MPKKVEKRTKKVSILPLGDRVLLRPVSQDELDTKTAFGIILPETLGKEKPQQGTIIAVGPGKYEDGKLVPVRVKVGDKVVYARYSFDEVKVGDEEYLIVKEENILAIIG